MDLNQISVFYPYKLCDTRAFCRQVTKRFVICNLISIYISPLLGYIPVPQTLAHRGKDSRLAPVQLLCVSCVIYVLLLAKGLTINLWRASNIFVNNLCGLGIPMRPFWPTTQLDVIHPQYWKIHLVTRDILLGLYLSYYLAVLFRLNSYMYIY